MNRHLLIAFLSLLVACREDAGNPLSVDFFAYDGQMEAGFSSAVIRLTEENGAYDLEVFLLGSGIAYNGEDDSFSGSGHVLRLDFNLSESELGEGSYTFSHGSPPFYGGSVGLNYNLGEDREEERGFFHALAEGTLEVKASEQEQYILEFDLVDETGKTVKGRYTGYVEHLEIPFPDFFEYGGEVQQVFDKAYLRSIADGDNYDVDLILVSPGISQDEESGSFSGVGNALRFDFTLSTPDLRKGEYPLKPEEPDPETLYLGLVAIKVDAQTGWPEEGGFQNFLLQGQLTVEVSEAGIYTLTFDFLDHGGHHLKGKYSGQMGILLQ